MADSFEQISSNELENRINDPRHRILDVRPIAAFNGWRLRGEKRGGHIPGAKSIPLRWTTYMDWVEVLEEKQIAPNEPVTVYGYEKEDTQSMAEKLKRLDYKDISIYNGFIDEWSADSNRPLGFLDRYQQLVYPEWLQSLMDGEKPEGYRGADYVVCHAHFDYIDDYHKGHIPGAIPLNTNDLESTETWNRRSTDELKTTLLRHGIRHDTTVVLYGRFSSPSMEHDYPGKSAGHLAAMRCAAILLYAGVEDVKILNGGVTPWEEQGFKLTAESSDPEPADDFGIEIPAHPEYMVDMDKAKELLASDDGELVSVRSWEEFIGNRSGYHYIEKKGRIPGAIFGNCGSDAYHMENYRNFDYTMREFPEIAQKWAEGGIAPEKHIAFYCGTGWRGSEAFMNAYLMGWPRISVYDGGWYEWSNHPESDIATGEPG